MNYIVYCATTRTVGPTLMVRTNDDTDDDNYKFATQFTCKLARNNNMIFIDIGNYKFQIILRLYNTISEILHGFDLGSCAVGFDGTTVFLTTLGKFCYEHMCNIVDVSKKSESYEARLEKYFSRGFNIILSKLNTDILKRTYFKYGLSEVCATPHFIFSYTNIIGNKITISKFYNKQKVESDYDNLIDMHGRYKVNLKNLIHDDHFYYSRSEDRNVNNIEILRKGMQLVTIFFIFLDKLLYKLYVY